MRRLPVRSTTCPSTSGKRSSSAWWTSCPTGRWRGGTGTPERALPTRAPSVVEALRPPSRRPRTRSCTSSSRRTAEPRRERRQLALGELAALGRPLHAAPDRDRPGGAARERPGGGSVPRRDRRAARVGRRARPDASRSEAARRSASSRATAGRSTSLSRDVRPLECTSAGEGGGVTLRFPVYEELSTLSRCNSSTSRPSTPMRAPIRNPTNEGRVDAALVTTSTG